MWSYILNRLLYLIPVIIGVSLITFFMVRIIPGDPVDIMLPEHATREDVEMRREILGLNDPLYVQYYNYVSEIVTFEFGRSIRTGRSIKSELLSRWPNTIELTVLALFLAASLGVPIGVISAVKRTTIFDYTSMTAALLGICMPSFFLALLLQYIFGMKLDLLPIFGKSGRIWQIEGLKSLILPAISLGLQSSALLARLTRSSMLDVLNQDYIRTARAKGLKNNKIIYKHALKNALIPVTTMFGMSFGALLGGAFITETIFALPGIGRYTVDAIFRRDIPIVQTIALMMAVIFTLANLLTDISYVMLDPRIRYD